MDVLIDGVSYVTNSPVESIGIGITTRNRPDMLEKCLSNMRLHLPAGARIVVVDDASTNPPESDYRFSEQAGISKAKDKCFELLRDSEHLFLFDDDCWPIVDGWEKPYIESPENHLMYIFDNFRPNPTLNDTCVIYSDDRVTAYSHPRGCMLYYTRKCLETVGGMDRSFTRWGFEHGDLSNRIHSAGLTTWRYADVTGSDKLIHSCDEWRECESTTPTAQRAELMAPNEKIHDERFDEPAYCDFMDRENVVLTTFLTGKPDPQPKAFPNSLDAINPLKASCTSKLVVIADVLEADVKVPTTVSPYFARWVHYLAYLEDHDEVDRCWMVDSVDVQMLHDPFPFMQRGILYVGSEPQTVDCPWLRQHHPYLNSWLDKHPGELLLNCGLIGGDRLLCIDLLKAIIREWQNAVISKGGCDYDMGPFNVAARKFPYVTGTLVHTVFKHNEPSGISWWKHK